MQTFLRDALSLLIPKEIACLSEMTMLCLTSTRVYINIHLSTRIYIWSLWNLVKSYIPY